MNPIWEINTHLPEFKSLKKDISTDVLIIGGGLAGVLTAYLLHKKGVSYALVEKNRILRGVSGHTTAKITFQHGLIYSKILKSYGTQTAQMYLRANMAAFDMYKKLCENIDCDYEIKDNYVYSLVDRKKLEDELSAVEKIGYHASFCEKLPLPIATKGAVRFSNQAQFDPLKFVSCISGGLNIYENTFVREMIGNTAVTDFGKINAKRVIVTTHFPFINKHGSYFLKLYQHRSYVIALENAQDVNGMYVDEQKTGLSFRNYGELLFLGGSGHRTGKQSGAWSTLRNFAKQKYPNSKEKYFWAAQDCMSLDGIPYIGRYSKRTHNLFVASGFNKWGMTGSMTAAMILSDMILQGHSEYENAFDPSRSILKPQLFKNGCEALSNILTFSKKRCPHMGCALKWNSAERSWDCPCHGSRFDEKGHIIDNPANGDLKKEKAKKPKRQ